MAVVGDGSWPCSGGRCGGWQPWHMWHWLSISGWSAVDGLVTWSGADIPAQAKARTVLLGCALVMPRKNAAVRQTAANKLECKE